MTQINAWYFYFQWDLFAYVLGLVSSVLYIDQIALLIFVVYLNGKAMPDYLVERYSWLGIWASALGLVQALLFMIGWTLGRYYRKLDNSNRTYEGDEVNDTYYCKDGNFWGNILLFIGAMGYVGTALSVFYPLYTYSAYVINIVVGFLMIIDTCFYFLAISQGERSRTSGTESEFVNSLKFHSSLDWYALATTFSFICSFVYFVAALYDILGRNSDGLYLWATLLLFIESTLYIISVFHFRYPTEVLFENRRFIFYIEIVQDDTSLLNDYSNKESQNS